MTYSYQILAYGFITMRQLVVYILDLSMTLTLDLYVGGGGHPFLVLLTFFILFSFLFNK